MDNPASAVKVVTQNAKEAIDNKDSNNRAQFEWWLNVDGLQGEAEYAQHQASATGASISRNHSGMGSMNHEATRMAKGATKRKARLN